jgi:osmotically-inducible protein OsmY
VARDEEIIKRLQSILHGAKWFTDPKVRVEEGVVFLYGQAASEEFKDWAGDLARNTQDVVAVVNRMEALDPPVLNFRPASSGLLM